MTSCEEAESCVAAYKWDRKKGREDTKKMCPDLHREIIMSETPSSVLHAITVNQPLQVATAFFLNLKPDQTLLMRSYHQRGQ